MPCQATLDEHSTLDEQTVSRRVRPRCDECVQMHQVHTSEQSRCAVEGTPCEAPPLRRPGVAPARARAPDPARVASEDPLIPSGIVISLPMAMARRVRPLSLLPPGPAAAARPEACRDVDITAANAHAADVTSEAETCSAMFARNCRLSRHYNQGCLRCRAPGGTVPGYRAAILGRRGVNGPREVHRRSGSPRRGMRREVSLDNPHPLFTLEL